MSLMKGMKKSTARAIALDALSQRMVTSDDAVATHSQHRKPCADCPFARTALQGWIGLRTVEEFIRDVHGEVYLECHCTTNQQCAGAAIYRANTFKSLRDKSLLRLPRDTSLVFATAGEFAKHHGGAS